MAKILITTIQVNLVPNPIGGGNANSPELSELKILLSRHMVVCRVAQEAGVPPVSILTGRKKMQFSHLCSSVIPYLIGTKFAREVPASKGSLHTKFEENRSSNFRDTSEQNFVLISSFFSSSTSSFRTLRKNRHKTQMHARIGLKFGTLEGLIKADLCTNFGRNPMKIHGIICVK